MTAWHQNSKADTVLLLDTATDDIFVDLGPARTNLADQTTYIDESPSARSALAAPWSITLRLFMDGPWGGTLAELGNAVGHSWRLRLSGGHVQAHEGGVLRVQVRVPGLSAEEAVIVHWAQRAEGASVVSELAAYNIDQAEWAFATATHAAATPNAAHTLTIAASFGGASAYDGGIAAFAAVHMGRRFRTTTETSEDWVGLSSPSAFSGYDRSPAFTGAAAELGIANEGSLAGPSLLMAAAATRKAEQRAVGAFVNIVPVTPAVEYNTNYPTHFYRATPDAWGLWCVRYLWHGYLSPQVNVARVRIHVTAYDLFAGVVISPLRFRSYSIANLPTGTPGDPAMTYYRGGVVSLTAPSVSGGEWVDLGVVRLARSASGLSYFALGFLLASTVDEGGLYSTTWELNAITVEPFAKSLEGGGDGDVNDKAGP